MATFSPVPDTAVRMLDVPLASCTQEKPALVVLRIIPDRNPPTA
jgi:hypothetical protein